MVRPNNIQDLLFLENRDRKYDPDVYDMRGVYQVQDSDFDLTQFGAFLSNDTIYMTFHLNDMIDIMGRKLMSGDVLELPHQRDDTMLDMARLEFATRPAKKFRKGETITGATSGVTATVVNYNHNAKVLRMVTDGDFITGETISGTSSTATAEVSAYYPEGPQAINRYYVIEDAARGSEGYETYSKSQMKQHIAWWQRVYKDCETWEANKKKQRKPRKWKPPSKEKMAAKVKYKPEFPELKLVSEQPINLIGCSAVIVYNTKNRKLGIYEATHKHHGLALKGTTLLNYDTDGALQKTVRKPQEVMEKLNKGGLQAIKNTFNALSTTETKLNGRLNKETVLIRIFQ